MPELVWLITGTSQGIGLGIAQEALSRGDKVIATARGPISRLAELEKAGAKTLELDVTWEPGRIAEVVKEAIGIYGRIDVVVPNAGYGEIGMIEAATPEIWQNIFNVNFYGVVNVVNAVLPQMRAQRSGYITFMNSVYSHCSDAVGGVYAVTKHATSAYSKSLVASLKQFNIHAISFSIGHVRTDVIEHMNFNMEFPPDYQETVNMAVGMASGMKDAQPGDPKECCARIVDVVKNEGLATGKPTPSFVPLGKDAAETVKQHAQATLKAAEEWTEVADSVEYKSERKGFFAQVPHYFQPGQEG